MRFCHIAGGLLALPLAKTYSRHLPQQPLGPTASFNAPQPGYGTWQLSNARQAVSTALQFGYEHIDCAAAYDNEVEVGKGIQDGLRKTGKLRKDIWVTSKLGNTDHGYDNVEAAIIKTLSDLDLDYLDLYLMHWPVASQDGVDVIEFMDTWRGMERLIRLGKTRFIGISNFDPCQVAQLQLHAQIKPAMHQMEAHPYLQQTEFIKFNHDLGIQVTASAPLGNVNPYYNDTGGMVPSILQNEVITNIARERGCTSAQVLLAWGMKRGTYVIPKSDNPDRMRENYDSLKCRLQAVDFESIREISEHIVKRFYNFSKGSGIKLFQGLEDSDS